RCVARRRTCRVVLPDDEDVERAGRLLAHDERTARRRELDLRGAAAGERSDRAPDRAELPVARAEAGDAAGCRVDNVDEVVTGSDADRLRPARGDAIAPDETVL